MIHYLSDAQKHEPPMARSVNEEPYCPGWAANVGAIPLKLNIWGALLSTMDINWNDYFVADFEAGRLTWKVRQHAATERARKVWNAKYAGKVAGSVGGEGYVELGLFKKMRKAHRILWEMAHGPIPDGLQIDHKDRNPSNNSLSNLRLATGMDNQRNRGIGIKNTSGAKGIHYHRQCGKWMARVPVGGQRLYLGLFASKEDAVKAHTEAVTKYHGEFAVTNDIEFG